MPENKLNPLALALGATALGGALAASPALAAEDPFRITELSGGYMVAGGHGEGGCGEGKCGAEGSEKKKDPCPHSEEGEDAEGKCGEGKCGEGRCGEGKCGEGDDAPAEGKCGEGKCGGN